MSRLVELCRTDSIDVGFDGFRCAIALETRTGLIEYFLSDSHFTPLSASVEDHWISWRG
ncbi:hypothetical protein AG1IA_05936 [Rhizoctonia solani AG-1 IA]|uniref:Uncharacterized protein n=1 Tax=Thanatephorus cucumeris (strain AG1-IA) TaxID=983506 RepID=L8WUJ3_THACA|nr:hypothetical protein AG1IA_05936 [Rhizoctonia solani AG-1 IA]